MNIRKAAERCGLTADTIRFYEREGVLPAPPRRANRYRDYSEAHVETLRLAKGLRDLGLPLDEMRMTLSVAHDGTCGDVRAALTDTLGKALKATDRRVRELSRARDQLTQLLDGLGDLQPGEQELPGVAPCECVRLVGHPRRRRSAARSTRS